MDFKISIALHIIGLIMWTGSLVIASRIIALSIKNNQLDTVRNWSKKITMGWMLPGLVVTITTGLYQLITRGLEVYMKQGWFHGKLTLVAILIVASILMIKLVSNPKATIKQAMIVHGLAAGSMLLIVLLTVLGR